jgi:hypothetical protein
MAKSDGHARDLLLLYRKEIRSFLSDNQVLGIESLDQLAGLLEGALAQKTHLNVGFLGESQVGKSTLINAVLGARVLPTGGIGPLTAQATQVSFGEQNTFTVEYHTKQQLHRFAFGLERYLEQRGVIPPRSSGSEVENDPDPDIELEHLEQELSEPGASSEKGEHMLKQAKTLIMTPEGQLTPDTQPNDSDGVALDGILIALGQTSRGSQEALKPYVKRIAELQQKLGGVEIVSESRGSENEFKRALRTRAAGWLSPLVSRLKVRLTSPLLKHLSITDLPGIGSMADPGADIAEKFVRTDGDTLVIVFRNSGVSQSIADLLERTGVITKLLFGSREGTAPIHIIIAVTHLDDVARSRYLDAIEFAELSDEQPPDKADIFRKLSADMPLTIRDGVAGALRLSKAFEDLPEDLRARREQIVSSLVDSMRIVCVAAPDCLAIASHRADQAWLQTEEATGVPEFREALKTVANEALSQRQGLIQEYDEALRSALVDQLMAVQQAYEGGSGAAAQEWERFRQALEEAAHPHKEQLKVVQGEALSTLKRTVPERIKALSDRATAHATRRLSRVIAESQDLHWKSIQAAIRGDGIWERRGVHYPRALTTALVDYVASDWEPQIVEGIRTEVRTLATRGAELVKRLCEDAQRINPRLMSDVSHVDTQRKILIQQSQTCVAWTKEQLETLRKEVHEELIEVVRQPITKACRKAVAESKHVGQGMKARVLSTFLEGGESAILEAGAAVERLLDARYRKLLKGLIEGFLKDNHDPIQDALERLTSSEASRVKRSDAQRRRKVLSEVARFSNVLQSREEAA